MRTLEHRRHSRRDPGGIHLNAEGVALARKVAATTPKFDRVATSPRPRAVETAELLAGRVDAVVPGLAEVGDELAHLAETDPPGSFARCGALIRQSTAAAEFGRAQLELWRAELERVPDGGRLLLVSHGGVIELGAVTALPESSLAWGGALGYLEGVRLDWDGRRWTSGAVLRVPAPPRGP